MHSYFGDSYNEYQTARVDCRHNVFPCSNATFLVEIYIVTNLSFGLFCFWFAVSGAFHCKIII